MNGENLQALKFPATALFISGILNLCFAVLTILGGIGRLALRLEELPSEDSELIGFLAGTVLGYGTAFTTIAASPVIIFGAFQMMKGESYRMSLAAAWLSVIPLTACCFVLGIPSGIWALAVLYRPENREIFGLRKSRGLRAPPPPQSRG